MRIRYGLGLTGSAIAALMQPAQAETGTWRFHADHVLGTSLDLAVVAKKPLAAALAIDAARAEIARLDKILSAWRSDSELMALNASDWLAVSRELFAVIALCEKMRETTGGAYSARIGRLLEACQDSAHDRARLAVKIETASLRLDAGTRTITRPKDVVFAVDGLAKGFIIDRAIAAARCVPGVDGVMVDIGGDLACWGAAPGGPNNNKAWRIGLVDPANPADNAPALSHIVLSNQAVATSGPSARGELAVSPLTGARVNHVAYATAVADSAAQADALATAFSVLPPSEALALADRLDNVAARIVTRDGKPYADPHPAGAGQGDALEGRKLHLLAPLRTQRRQAGGFGQPPHPPAGPVQHQMGRAGRCRQEGAAGQVCSEYRGQPRKGGHTVQRLELMLNADGAVVEAKPDGEVGKVRATYGRSQ